ncbi:sulfatase-like hydrolase/transferase [Clostridioides sp. ES-S-0108-01]|uniref:sulfatase-like hydrolase/transferase n=1 Tax=Clostridioides sp. ES-S-0108-01 TaxID=2770773 RepID=UPI001D0C3DC7|nr:sulfatase-like hydrolase/transferase [Clostridioides sp. ES-S-0108-01]UDN51119.1 sulfatase-like hydrolase/transferase [Clostridioides sp. ES-S-0107-01]
MKRKNILMFVADQMRSDSLAHLGNEASITPNLDEVVNDGVSFENAYCQNPVCVPSRCSFLTGLYPHTTGHRTMHFLQREDEPNILKTMKENGYEVFWVGRNDVVPADRRKTNYCDEYYDGISDKNSRDEIRPGADFKKYMGNLEISEKDSDNYYSFYSGKLKDGEGYGKVDWNCVNRALEIIERKSKGDDEKPFFIYCTLSFPHPPYACEEPWYSSIDRKKLPKRRENINNLKNKASMLYAINSKQRLNEWSEERFDELRATYLAMVSRFDYQFGMVVDKLKKTNQYDDTNIFVFSDHGDFTGDYSITEKAQNSFEDPISKVPLLIKPANNINVKPRISKALVELLDIPVTIAEMAGVSLGYTQFGKSLISSLEGEEIHKDAVFCEGGRIHGEVQAMEGGHGPESPYWPRLSTQCSEGPEHTKACMIRMGNFKLTIRLYEKDELYDLDNDSMELNNIIDNKEYREVYLSMKERLLKYYMETTDFVPNKRDKR